MIAWFAVAPPDVCADPQPSVSGPNSALLVESPAARQANQTVTAAPPTLKRIDEKALLEALRTEWEALRADLTQAAVTTMTTMFLGRWGTPPPPPKGQGGPNTPPPNQGGGGGNTPPPPPPPPGGGGQTPPGNPPPDPPVTGTPEPASLLTALVGTGLVALGAWRKRRRKS
jgi:hypothetical protein